MWRDVDPAAGEPQEHLIRENPSCVEGRAVSLDQSVPSVANAVPREGYVHAPVHSKHVAEQGDQEP